MSQPMSGCNTWIDDLVSLNNLDSIIPSSSAHHGRPTPPCTTFDSWTGSEGPAEMDIDADDHTAHVDPDFNSDISQPQSLQVGSQEICDLFPGAARIFTSGPTFMNKFDADQFNGYCTGNLYYLFASREEWALALWLLHSGLSMRAIDVFLKLSKVRHDITSLVQT
jgi:hypothetical protein